MNDEFIQSSPKASNGKVTSTQMCKVTRHSLGRDGDKLVKLINNWASTRGKSECISMMKNRWNYIQHLAAEDLSQSEMIELASKYRIRLKPNSIYPFGVYGNLAHNYVKGGPRTRERIASCLKSYTMITPKLTDRMVWKLLDPIRNLQDIHWMSVQNQNEIKRIATCFSNSPYGRTLIKDLRQFLDEDWYSKLDLTCFKMSKSRYISPEYEHIQKSTNLIEGFLLSYPSNPDFYEALADGELYDVNDVNLSSLFAYSQEIEGTLAGDTPGYVDYDTINCGLRIIPKSGANGRVIASLNSWDQLLLYPLHCALDDWTKKIPIFRHYNQLSGASAVASWKDSIAIDLSNATDTVPVDLFFEFLRQNDLEEILDVVESVSSRTFRVKLPSGKTTNVHYERGQPMGMFASFPILQICNLMVAYTAHSDMHDSRVPLETIPEVNSSMVIVGDDIAFKERSVANRYSEIMNTIGVPINKYKCFSNKKSQFAGFEIDKLSGRFADRPTYYRPFKFQTGRHLSDKKTLLGLYYTFPDAWEIKYRKKKRLTSLPILYNPQTPIKEPLKRSSLLPDLTYIESTHVGVPSKTRSKDKLINRLISQINGILLKYSLDSLDHVPDPLDHTDQCHFNTPYDFSSYEYVERYGDSEISEDIPDLTQQSKKGQGFSQ